MQTLKLGFTDTIEPVKDFFTEVLSKDFNVVRDDVNPDYLIFGDRNFGEHNKSFNDKNVIKIFYTGENQRAWDYDCHFAITFDHIDNERHYRLPLYVIYDWDNKRKGLDHVDSITKKHFELEHWNRDFCSFIVKNGGCEKRNTFFHKLSTYKKVTAAGPLFNNTGEILEGGANAVQAKLSYLPKFKFTMCFENSSYPGYATEKLYEAFLGQTIPIYWGSTTIAEEFNPRAFLNWHDYLDDDAFLEAIIKVDESMSLYGDMFCEPMFRDRFPVRSVWDDTQGCNKYFNMDRFRSWFGKNAYKGQLS